MRPLRALLLIGAILIGGCTAPSPTQELPDEQHEPSWLDPGAHIWATANSTGKLSTIMQVETQGTCEAFGWVKARAVSESTSIQAVVGVFDAAGSAMASFVDPAETYVLGNRVSQQPRQPNVTQGMGAGATVEGVGWVVLYATETAAGNGSTKGRVELECNQPATITAWNATRLIALGRGDLHSGQLLHHRDGAYVTRGSMKIAPVENPWMIGLPGTQALGGQVVVEPAGTQWNLADGAFGPATVSGTIRDVTWDEVATAGVGPILLLAHGATEMRADFQAVNSSAPRSAG